MAYNYLTDKGIVVADTSTILTEVQKEYTDTFGLDLDLEPSTPQGRLIEIETTSRIGASTFMAEVATQFNPNFAGGIFLDAISALTGIQRVQATYTTVTATLTGDVGTIIPSGSQASTTSGDVFQLLTTTTIPISGTIDAIFQSSVIGAIPCLAGTLTTIQSQVIGWLGVTNALDGILGINKQSDISLRTFRSDTLANYAIQTTGAIISALYKTKGVLSFSFLENNTSSTAIIETITLLPHSIWTCVNGGTDTDVAQTIFNNRSAGCNFNGLISVPITAQSGQIINILFDRPTTIPMLIKITLKINGGLTATQIQQNIYDYANGKIDGEKGFVVGANVSPFEIGASVSGDVYIKLVEIAPSSTAIFQTTEYPIAINELAIITSLSSIQVILI